jgi:very-short-patch-repair endonuclease
VSVEPEIEHAERVKVRRRAHLVADLAARQHGVVARQQLLGLGVGRGAIWRDLEGGRLHAAHRGVYVVGHPGITARGRWMAAVLSAGEGALLSHRSAAALWGMLDVPGGRVDVLGGGKGNTGVRIHESDNVSNEDREMRDGIPVTAPSRTLVDLAGVVSARRLGYAFEAAERQQLLDVEKVLALCGRRRGTKALRALIADQHEPDPVRSRTERRFLSECRRFEIPKPAVNVAVGDITVDFMWPRLKLAVELDTYGFHGSRRQFEEDRRRDLVLRLAGITVVRITDRQLKQDSARTMGSLRELLLRVW